MIGKTRDKDLKRKELKRKAIAIDEVNMEQFQFSEATFYVSPNTDWQEFKRLVADHFVIAQA